MCSDKQKLGKTAEQLARRILEKRGFRVIELNFFCRFGELDIITQDIFGTIVFVEVKSLTSEAFLSLSETLTCRKLQRLQKTIRYWLVKHYQSQSNWRLDFLGLVLTVDRGHIKRLLYHENVLEIA